MAEKITQRGIAALQPKTILWDSIVRGFNARRQFSDVITYNIFFRTYDGTQRWMKIGRHPIFTPNEARKQAIRLLHEVLLAQGWLSEALLRSLNSATNINQICRVEK